MAVFSVGGVIRLVTSFHERDFSLLSHVKYDSCLITSQRDRFYEHTHNITITIFMFQICQLAMT